MKKCTKCYETFDEDMFHNRKYKTKDGSVKVYKRSECMSCTNKINAARYHTNPATKEAHKKAAFKYSLNSYGISFKDYNEMYNSQKGCCYICGEKGKRRLSIDHNHRTGQVRKLLCNNCNTAIGHSREDIEILEKMIKYLREYDESMCV